MVEVAQAAADDLPHRAEHISTHTHTHTRIQATGPPQLLSAPIMVSLGLSKALSAAPEWMTVISPFHSAAQGRAEELHRQPRQSSIRRFIAPLHLDQLMGGGIGKKRDGRKEEKKTTRVVWPSHSHERLNRTFVHLLLSPISLP